MTASLIRAGIRFRALVLVAAVLLLAGGLAAWKSMPADVLPEFSPTQVEVQTEALGLSAAEVEQMLTVPLEADLLNGVPWLADIESKSLPGVSQVILTFQPGTDELRARQVVNERITQAKALPNVSSPPVMLEPRSSASRVLMVAMKPKDASALINASVQARYSVRPKLMSVAGVANVVMWGEHAEQLQLQVIPGKMADADVSLDDVVETAGNAMWVSPLSFLEASSPGSGGFIETANQRLGIQHISPIVSPDTLAQVAIQGDKPGEITKLGEVGRLVTDHQPLIGDTKADNEDALLLVVEKSPGANTLEVTRNVERALDELRPGLAGIDLDTSYFRPADYLELATHDFGTWLLVGALLGMVGIGLLLFSWRAAVISAASVLVSLAVAVIGLHVIGASLNAVALAGLVVAIAVLVDDAVLDVAVIRERLADAPADQDGTEVVARASLDVRTTALYAAAAALVVAVPVLVLGGQQRALYTPLVIGYAIAVAASTIVALILTPALCTLLLRPGRPVRAGDGRLRVAVRRLTQRYQDQLSALLERPKVVLAAGLAVVVLALAALPLLSGGPRLLPAMRDSNLLVEFATAPGTALGEVDRITGAAARELRKVPGVKHVAAQAGRAIFGDQAVNVDSSELWVTLDEDADYGDTLAKMRSVVAGYPGVKGRVTTYDQRQAGAILGDAPKDITVRVSGQDEQILAAKADEIARMMRDVPGVVDPKVQSQAQQPTLIVEPNLLTAQKFGIKPGDIRRAAAVLVQGMPVGALYQDQKIFDVVVWSIPEVRQSVSAVQNLTVDTPTGSRVKLGDVAGVRIEPRPTVIRHSGTFRMVDVTASVQGRSVAAASADVAARLGTIQFPLEHYATVLGDYAAGHDDRSRVIEVALAAMLLVYLLLQGAVGGWKLAGAVFLAQFVAVAGALLGALVDGAQVSLGTFAGGLAVLALALRHSVLYIRRAQALLAEDGGPLGPAVVLRAARERFGPVFTTVVGVALVLLPAVLLGGRAGLEIVHPMAMSILFGLVTSGFVTLIVVPLLFLTFGAPAPAAEADAPGGGPAEAPEAAVGAEP